MIIAQLKAASRVILVPLFVLFLATSVAAGPLVLSTGKASPALSAGPASAAYSKAVGGALNSFGAGDLVSMAPSLRTSLPVLGKMNFKTAMGQNSIGPVIYNIERSLEIPIEEFESMSPESQREVVAMAVEDSIREAETAAFDLVNEAYQAMVVSPSGLPSRDLMQRMERVGRDYGGLLGRDAGTALTKTYREAKKRANDLKKERLSEMMGETADALKSDVDPELLFTTQFSNDAKNFSGGDWERLGREFSKLRTLLQSDTPRKGAIGNIKFLSGPLAGIGEFKFGTNRTHRIYFKYRPEDDTVALLHYASRESANNPARVYGKVQGMVESGLDAQAVRPSTEVQGLMAAVEEADLDALGTNMWNFPSEEEPQKMADRAPEEGDPPPSPVAKAAESESFFDRVKGAFFEED